MAVDTKLLSDQVDANFDYFQRALRKFLERHLGEYALLRDRAVVAFYAAPGEADRAGTEKFHDGLYSIQEVTDEPVNLGLYSNAAN